MGRELAGLVEFDLFRRHRYLHTTRVVVEPSDDPQIDWTARAVDGDGRVVDLVACEQIASRLRKQFTLQRDQEPRSADVRLFPVGSDEHSELLVRRKADIEAAILRELRRRPGGTRAVSVVLKPDAAARWVAHGLTEGGQIVLLPAAASMVAAVLNRYRIQ